MRQQYQFIMVCFALVAALVTGCNVAPETKLSKSRVELRQETETAVYKLEALGDPHFTLLAEDFAARGVGVLSVSVVYDPSVEGMSAQDAVDHATQLRARLAEDYGVGAIKASVVPVASTQDGAAGDVIFSYRALNAVAPKDCVHDFPGIHGARQDIGEYKMGCENQKVLSKMVARPRDLLGNDDLAEGEARRQAIVTERHISADPETASPLTEKLPGFTSTDVGE